MVTTESEALAILHGRIPESTELDVRVQLALEMLRKIDTRNVDEAARLARENILFGHPDMSRVNGKPHHMDLPQHGGVETNIGFRRP